MNLATHSPATRTVDNKRRRVLFLLPSLSGGGAERIVTTLLNNLDREQFELHLGLALADDTYRDLLPSDVPVHDLRSSRVRFALPQLLHLIRKIKPDTVFATLDHLNLAVLLLRPLIPRSTRVVIRPTSVLAESVKQFRWPALILFLYRKLLPRADRIICQSDHMQHELARLLGRSENLKRIYNPVDISAVRKQTRCGDNPFKNHGPGPHIVAAGRIAPQKQFDRIVAQLPRWLEEDPNTHLWILGTGPDKGRLEKQARDLGVSSIVHFPGFQPAPGRWFHHADLFVLASVHDALPNVLLEALASGCPSLVKACPGGCAEVAQQVGDEFCRLVSSLPERLPEMGRSGTSLPNLSQFHVKNVIRIFAGELAGNST